MNISYKWLSVFGQGVRRFPLSYLGFYLSLGVPGVLGVYVSLIGYGVLVSFMY